MPHGAADETWSASLANAAGDLTESFACPEWDSRLCARPDSRVSVE
jgi:hypothetical protein